MSSQLVAKKALEKLTSDKLAYVKGGKYSYFHIQYVYDIFVKIFSKYATDVKMIDILFEDMIKRYSASGRYYHDTHHIYGMVSALENSKELIKDYDAIFMAIIYHDIIYKPVKKNNEEKSAQFFRDKVAKNLNLEFQFILKVYKSIIATKHDVNSKFIWENDTDVQYLIDFDLEILGTMHASTYEWYRSGVRKEYRIYPDILYKPGRKKVLESFLFKKNIYLTKKYQVLQKNARKNLENEIKLYLC